MHVKYTYIRLHLFYIYVYYSVILKKWAFLELKLPFFIFLGCSTRSCWGLWEGSLACVIGFIEALIKANKSSLSGVQQVSLVTIDLVEWLMRPRLMVSEASLCGWHGWLVRYQKVWIFYKYTYFLLHFSTIILGGMLYLFAFRFPGSILGNFFFWESGSKDSVFIYKT